MELAWNGFCCVAVVAVAAVTGERCVAECAGNDWKALGLLWGVACVLAACCVAFAAKLSSLVSLWSWLAANGLACITGITVEFVTFAMALVGWQP